MADKFDMRLYRLHLICVLLVSSLQAASAPATKKVETSPLAFATAFIDQLAATEDVRAAGEREMVAATSDKGKIVTMIHMSAAMELELGSEVLALRQMYLSGPFGFLPGSLAELYEQKILRYKIMGKICEQFLAGPRPDVNYGELTSLLPGLRADLEFIDKGIFKELLPGVFATLKKDPKRKVLILSSAEKQQLIDHITSKSNGMRGLVS